MSSWYLSITARCWKQCLPSMEWTILKTRAFLRCNAFFLQRKARRTFLYFMISYFRCLTIMDKQIFHNLPRKSTGSMHQARKHPNGIFVSRTILFVSGGMIWKTWDSMTPLTVSEINWKKFMKIPNLASKMMVLQYGSSPTSLNQETLSMQSLALAK